MVAVLCKFTPNVVFIKASSSSSSSYSHLITFIFYPSLLSLVSSGEKRKGKKIKPLFSAVSHHGSLPVVDHPPPPPSPLTRLNKVAEA